MSASGVSGDGANGTAWTPTREEALRRLEAFVPRAGRAYAATRNEDRGPGDRSNVSALSPYVSYRLLHEREIVAAVLEEHAPRAAEKFVQEVCWRTYWKGWLEMRPGVWSDYVQSVALQHQRFQHDDRYRRALAGETGIDCFDAWREELRDEGYLHNHARMWFASIWIHTLELPWPLGAALFHRELLDADSASNTLSWRWVAGLQTRGKAYLAISGNIARYSAGRFPSTPGLADLPMPLDEAPYGRDPLEALAGRAEGDVLLLHSEMLAPEPAGLDPAGYDRVVIFDGLERGPGFEAAAPVTTFAAGATANALSRIEAVTGRAPARLRALDLPALSEIGIEAGSSIVAFRPCVGFLAALFARLKSDWEAAGGLWTELRSSWDAAFFPEATAGFFRLKKSIPVVLSRLGLV
ncbi:hypothetical protein ABI59_11735 [Acidobacteria bacterium Mor1]|nr:hypothetical protein ABI59_11735 [Acidobacteria bacterium Mor1]